MKEGLALKKLPVESLQIKRSKERLFSLALFFVFTFTLSSCLNRAEDNSDSSGSSFVFAGATSATALTATSIQIQWSLASNLDVVGYRIYQVGADGNLTGIANQSAASTTYTHSNLTPGETYLYIVRAVNNQNTEDGNQKIVSASTSNDSFGFLGVTSATVVSNTGIRVSWSAATGDDIAGYTIYKKESGSLTQIGSVIAGVTSYINSGLSANTLYIYVVRAFNASGEMDTNEKQVSAMITFPTTLSLSGDQDIVAGVCYSGYTVTGYDDNNIVTAAQDPVTIGLSGNGSGAFYSDANCTNVVTSAVLANGETTVTMYYMGGDDEDLTFDVAATGLTGDTLSVSVTAPSQVATGKDHSCAVVDGGVRCWGRNHYGQLGDGTNTDSLTPVDVLGLTSGVSDIALGRDHSCAITSGGAAKCWGYNQYGSLGNDSNVHSNVPVDVSGLNSGVTEISAGVVTCAVVSGGAKCWGQNTFGMLGDGTTTLRRTPVDVTGLTSGVSQIATNGYHSCALTTGGGVKCWGYNSGGQVGDGSTTDRLTAVDVTGLTSGVSDISLGFYHSCALITATGGMKCWGTSTYGQVGDGATAHRSTPVDVSGLTSGVSGMAMGTYHSCATLSAGGVRCWGRNVNMSLGDGTEDDSSSPVLVSGIATTMSTDIQSLWYHTCVQTDKKGVKCWGDNSYGQAGDVSSALPFAYTEITSNGSLFKEVQRSNVHSCALTTDGGVKCWGHNGEGQLGDGTQTMHFTPADVTGLTSGATSLAVGYYHSCAVVNGGVKCWGSNSGSQLGDGTTTRRLSPVDVSGLTSGVSAVYADYYQTCAVLTTGAAKCWGSNSYGQLGNGTTTNASIPQDVTGLTSGVSVIDMGLYHTCAVVDGGAKCWGDNGSGQVGDGTTTGRTTPEDVTGLNSGVSSVSVGYSHSCALLSTGDLRCWGRNQNRQLGDGTTTSRITPVAVLGYSSGVMALTSGDYFNCVLLNGGGMQCWGDNEFGYLGLSERLSYGGHDVGSVANPPSNIDMFSAGYGGICALSSTGVISCNGDNLKGQLGLGFDSRLETPVSILAW
jgi:alpha-tubulin suppressor-like RCC1 family protein